MVLFDYVKRFFKSFKKNEIRERIRTVKHLLASPVLQSVEALDNDPIYDEQDFKSDYARKFMAAWNAFLPKTTRVDRNKIYLSVLRPAVVNASALMDMLDEYVHKQLDDVIHIEGMTYQKATVLRLVELVNFFGDYAIRQLSYLVASEANLIAFEKIDSRPFNKGEEEYLQGQNQVAYFRMLELLSNDPKTILTQILKIRDVIIDEESNRTTLGQSDDPLRLGFIPLVSSFVMWNGIRQVDADAARLERAVKEERVIKVRLEALRQRSALGHPDARTESVIQNYDRELILARDKIATLTRKLQPRSMQ